MVESLQHGVTENPSSIQRRNMSSAQTRPNDISGAQPHPNDVILGREKRYENNPGNLLFQGTHDRPHQQKSIIKNVWAIRSY